MFARWGSFVGWARWLVLVVAAAAPIAGGLWGSGLLDHLGQGGYDDPTSRSATAARVAQEALGRQDADVIAVYTVPAESELPIDDPGIAGRVTARLRALPAAEVGAVTSYWQAAAQHAPAADTLITADRRSALAVITLASADGARQLADYRAIRDSLGAPGVEVALAGTLPVAESISSRVGGDLHRAELVSLPLVLVLLVLVFGGFVAASLPVVIGAMAILGSLGVLRLVSMTGVVVNAFAVNVVTLLGLGLAIDYGLFMVTRFREELQAGMSTQDAVRRTVATSGRTAALSATLLAVAMGGLTLFPQNFLQSLGLGGIAAVAVAAGLALTLQPALLAVLGRRVDALALPYRRRAAARRPGEGRPRRRERHARRGWERLAYAVMRRPVVVSVLILAGLLALGGPFLHVRFGQLDQRVLPAQDPARLATDELARDFPELSGASASVVVRTFDGAGPMALPMVIVKASTVPGVTSVVPAGGRVDPAGHGVTVLRIGLLGDPSGERAMDAVRGLRGLSPPIGSQLLVGGTTATVLDSVEAIRDTMPRMLAVLVVATLVLIFLAFGSVLVPVKAVLMSALSLSATFGFLVYVFQDGHDGGLLGVTAGPLEAGVVVLIAAVVFGLSTDYETFLLSRVAEARAGGASTQEAVARGLASTGRVISAAAVLLVVVIGAFSFSSVEVMRFVGVGMIVALVLDATVVRLLLVPALLTLMGEANWWAPGWLRAVHRRAGLADFEPLAGAPPEVGSTESGDADTHASRRPVQKSSMNGKLASPNGKAMSPSGRSDRVGGAIFRPSGSSGGE